MHGTVGTVLMLQNTHWSLLTSCISSAVRVLTLMQEQVNTMLATQQFDVSGIDEELDALQAEVMHEEVAAMPSAPEVRLDPLCDPMPRCRDVVTAFWCVQTVPAQAKLASKCDEPHVRVHVEGHKDSAEVSFSVQESQPDTEFPIVPTHEAAVPSGMEAVENEAELVPA